MSEKTMEKSPLKKGRHRKVPPPKQRKPGFAARALLAAAGTLGMAFGIAADHSAVAEQQQMWVHKPPLRYAFGEEHQPPKVTKSRLLIQAWSAVSEAIPGDIGYMDTHAPDINKPLTFLVAPQAGSKKFGVSHNNIYKVTVQCRNTNGLACNIADVAQMEAKDYRSLEESAQDTANATAPGHNVQLQISDPARQVVIFDDLSLPTPNLIKVKCTNPLKYSCHVM
jgi:hypothetical protein